MHGGVHSGVFTTARALPEGPTKLAQIATLLQEVVSMGIINSSIIFSARVSGFN